MYNVGDSIKIGTGQREEVRQVMAREGCGAMSRRDILYRFDNGLTLTGRELVLNRARAA